MNIIKNYDQQNKQNLNTKYHPSGALHNDRWMAKAIYTLKMYLFKFKFKLSKSDACSLRNICLFIVKMYVKAWFMCPINNSKSFVSRFTIYARSISI